jgi:RhtB (resistance to homoserine/threonine) family protein
MFGITNFTAFVIAGILLNLTPGSDTMYVLGRSISEGKKAGIMSVFGISIGCLVHTVLAAFGLSFIIAQSDLAFNIIKYAGAIYLCFLGVRMIQKKTGVEVEIGTTQRKKYWRIFFSGIFTNVLNPKVALFFLAFLPQFVKSSQVNSPLPFLILGLTFIVTGTIWCLILVLFSSLMAERLKRNNKLKNWLEKIAGSVFIALGLKLAFQTKE